MISRMRALVTGSSGFVGFHLVDHLNSLGVNVVGMDHVANPEAAPKLDKFHHGKIENQELVFDAAIDCDVIFHLAGALGTDYLMDKWPIAIDSNIKGTCNVLEAARRHKSKVVFLSLLPEWENPYMITKNAAAHFCRMYNQFYKVPVVVLKATHIYGSRQKWHPVRKAVPYFIVSALHMNRIGIYGSGEQMMDMIYVEDAVKAIVAAATEPAAVGCAIELGSGTGITVNQLAKQIKKLCGSQSEIVYEGGRIGEPESPDSFVPARTEQMKQLLNFSCETPLEAGLDKTIEWYRENCGERRISLLKRFSSVGR